MSNLPQDIKYAESHEWLKIDADGIATIGITDYAQGSLGDITYVQLPKAGDSFKVGESFGVVESVKAASDLYAPVAGTVVEVNAALDASPDLVNTAPFTDGWMLKIRMDSPASTAALLDAEAYAKLTA
ncbi:glycine cleavage system H protein [Ereboglobus sp. PH5-5]|uniref:glycine cleavage system protein GcvH n=1 Tax=unclassified Ereboglobus TaxID=2626932 RepID=UPI0024069BB3|nr:MULTISPECIES: glycine cleavage system protein GcvH [unclassified Ereboglobus]MDF9827803.1 glycine cleavage system H protein [Ereboglobus sp. PH5-10]MDF9833582.1 glycine cleavage system H protein [Ereboglobus sp. PH5-5]